MERVTGIGGVFFKAKDPKALQAWYVQHLGFPTDKDGYISFRWHEQEDASRQGLTVWSTFPEATAYFQPSTAPFMLNYRVANLDAMLEQLRAAGVSIDEKREDSEFGRFAWVMDPEGNRIELWQPPAKLPE